MRTLPEGAWLVSLDFALPGVEPSWQRQGPGRHSLWVYRMPLGGVLNGINLNESSIKSSGVGTAGQSASLNGAVSVTVVEVLANGNLMVRGEKQLALTEGAEVIQVSGIIRPDDVSPNNMVQSRRLANAQIAYRGTGDMAAVAKTGWGTKALLKLWPF